MTGKKVVGTSRRTRGTAGRRNVRVEAKVREIFMPALSSTMTEGKIVNWLKSEGDAVTKGETVVVVESDKADMDVESFVEGFIGHIAVGDGDTAAVGAPIAFVAETEAEIEECKKMGGSAPAAAAPPPAEAAATPPPAAPVAAEPKAEAAPPPPPPAPAAPVATAPAPAAPQRRTDGRIIATPYAKKLAKELRVDLSQVVGTGVNGRIDGADVEAFAAGNGAVAAPAAASTPAPAAPAAPASAAQAPAPAAAAATPAQAVGGTIEKFTSLQAAVARNMEASLAVPEFRVCTSITTDKLDALYKKLKPKGVTMTGLLCKAVGVALADHPIMFAACTPDGTGIQYNEHVNVAVAVAMPDGGLITPVLQDADQTDIYQLSRNWADLVKRARSKNLKPDEYSSGNFTVSNLGMFDVDNFDAILPVGTAAILAVGSSKPMVVATDDGKIGVEKRMQVNITCDHRIVYGADAAQFLQTLKSVIENPDQLTM